MCEAARSWGNVRRSSSIESRSAPRPTAQRTTSVSIAYDSRLLLLLFVFVFVFVLIALFFFVCFFVVFSPILLFVLAPSALFSSWLLILSLSPLSSSPPRSGCATKAGLVVLSQELTNEVLRPGTSSPVVSLPLRRAMRLLLPTRHASQASHAASVAFRHLLERRGLAEPEEVVVPHASVGEGEEPIRPDPSKIAEEQRERRNGNMN